MTFNAFSRVLEDNEMKLTVRVMNTLGMKSRSGKYNNLAFLLSDHVETVVLMSRVNTPD